MLGCLWLRQVAGYTWLKISDIVWDGLGGLHLSVIGTSNFLLLSSGYGSYPLNLRPFPCLPPCCPLKSPMFLRSVMSDTSRFLPSLSSFAAAAAAAMSALRE